MSDIINYISTIITDDPDIFEEVDISGSSSSMSSSPNQSSSNQAMNQLLKAQEAQQKKSESERQKRIEPKIDKIDRGISKINASNIARKNQDAEINNDINDNISSIQDVMASLKNDI